MNLKDLFDAEIFVDTVFSTESGAGSGTRFYLSDYSTMHEFTTDCASWFSDEETPEYIYKDWTGIPDCLISNTWLCPNIFEIRDAIQMLDRESIGSFGKWCADNGHDLKTDDATMLVTRYQDYVLPSYEPDLELTEPPDDIPCFEPLPIPLNLLLGSRFGVVEIFDENYN
jgi:hypothetical protein